MVPRYLVQAHCVLEKTERPAHKLQDKTVVGFYCFEVHGVDLNWFAVDNLNWKIKK